MTKDENSLNPLDRLQHHYEDVDTTCPECGMADDGGKWQAETDGNQIRYRHVCPGCGEIQTHTIVVEE